MLYTSRAQPVAQGEHAARDTVLYGRWAHLK